MLRSVFKLGLRTPRGRICPTGFAVHIPGNSLKEAKGEPFTRASMVPRGKRQLRALFVTMAPAVFIVGMTWWRH